jgi:hypothetical protein
LVVLNLDRVVGLGRIWWRLWRDTLLGYSVHVENQVMASSLGWLGIGVPSLGTRVHGAAAGNFQ